MRLARADMAKPRINIDYTLLLGTSNLVLKGDTNFASDGSS